MSEFQLVARFPIEAPPRVVLDWLRRPAAARRLTPRPGPLSILEPGGESGRRTLQLRLGPLRGRLSLDRALSAEPPQLVETQAAGPFSRWRQATSVLPDPGGSILEERVDAAWTSLFARAVRRGLRRQFTFRQQLVAGDLARHALRGAADVQTVAISGASGLVGSALADFLEAGGHSVLRFVRGPSGGAQQISWDPKQGAIEARKLEGVDAVVHLAGESVAGGRWTAARKERIRASRIAGTRLIAETLAGLARPPRTLINASAIGYYGDRGAEAQDETSPAGAGFLADTCRAWEAATLPAERAGVRVVRLRIGVVLAAAGGALAQMLTPFRLGLGGPIGDGRQFMSWIALDDLLGVVHHALFDATLDGPVNAVAPAALPNADFARVLGRVLARPARLALPRAAVSLGFGEMGRELLLAGARIEPARLTRAGFCFRHAELESALRFELRRFPPGAPGPEIHCV